MKSFQTPRIVGHFDQPFFDDVRTAVANNFKAEEGWHDGGEDWVDGSENNSEFLNVLRPLTNVIPDDCRRTPAGIRYNVSIGDVDPEDTQRGPGWHVDGGKNYGQYLLSDTMPTECLVRNPDLSSLLKIIQQKIYQNDRRKRPYIDNTKDISKLGLAIHIPHKGDLIIVKNNIHRSPINNSDYPVRRTFIRASLMHPKDIDR